MPRDAERQRRAARMMAEAARGGGITVPGGLRHGAYLPDHWRAWLGACRPETGGKLQGADFGGVVRLRFEDGSEAVFQSAFCVHHAEDDEIGVFTEHCGYHVFSSRGLAWDGPLLDWNEPRRAPPL